MTKKTKYKLKLWPKILLVVLIILGIAGYYGYQEYQKYLYTQTYEYKFVEIGYTKENNALFEKKLSDKELDKLLTYDYNEFIPEFINCKYFMFKNLDVYLTQVITQEDDFFKYHGTEGYDYDHIVSLVNVGAIYNHYENTTKTDRDMDEAMLVNKYTELGSDYEPTDLVSIDWKYRFGMENDKKYIRQVVYDAFLDMWTAAQEEGIYLLIDSGYRSAKDQEEVYKYYENLKGTKYADTIAARAGYSEHQTGLSLDIYSKECSSAKTFKDSKSYKWLIDNCYKYGFILRYPEGKKDLTGYEYESWHYRYVGKDLAKKVYESGLTYDEYYAFYLN